MLPAGSVCWQVQCCYFIWPSQAHLLRQLRELPFGEQPARARNVFFQTFSPDLPTLSVALSSSSLCRALFPLSHIPFSPLDPSWQPGVVLPALAARRCLCRGSAARPAAPCCAGGPVSSSRSAEYKKGIFLRSKSTALPRGTEHKSLPRPSFPCLSTFFFRGPAACLADSPRPSLKSREQPGFLHQVVISLLGT